MVVTDFTITEARIDYLTVAARQGRPLDQLADIAGVGLWTEQQRGERLRTWQQRGRHVARAGSWLLALSREDGYAQISGVDAERWARALLPICHHCSRIDYCVTIQAADPEWTPTPSILAMMRDRYSDPQSDNKISTYSGLHLDHGLAIASRQSAYYGRVYNKHAESPTLYPPGAWRYEIELKRHASEYEQTAASADLGRLDRAGEIVRDHMSRWGITVPCTPGPTVSLAVQRRPPSDAERSLTWLRSQVAPTIQWLRDIGRGEDAEQALGLSTVTKLERERTHHGSATV